MSAVDILRTYHIHHYSRHNDEDHHLFDMLTAADQSDGTQHPAAVDLHGPLDIPDFINDVDFMAICPAIIYQLDEQICQTSAAGRPQSSMCRGDVGRRRNGTGGWMTGGSNSSQAESSDAFTLFGVSAASERVVLWHFRYFWNATRVAG